MGQTEKDQHRYRTASQPPAAEVFGEETAKPHRHSFIGTSGNALTGTTITAGRLL
jgi:hypothetical protein